jgi:hypothetical protein
LINGPTAKPIQSALRERNKGHGHNAESKIKLRKPEE